MRNDEDLRKILSTQENPITKEAKVWVIDIIRNKLKKFGYASIKK
jgi:hypothetical protein